MMRDEMRPDIFQCALAILSDECPPERHMYLCNMGEDPECDCKECWTNYLFYVVNGRKDDPYKWDKIKEEGI